ncbi:DNA translocase FtsK 4TM domain-containing protein [Vibrio tapetis subsp. quintayensis]|uniref:DNA translocase FtsK n=1 Tax=Vibrio tapetis TaxID=52443 RepID=UPI0025B28791|nr:DNA translocase FtsK [Vibrio tapetis]MDN3682349.1 DNA translocase FtsK 4TM domain-containing protein [Vibrio tapetis subsp. quintayensis]
MFKENKEKVETFIKSQESANSSRLDGVQRLRDCCFIVGCLIAILVSIALLSFNPADPSWSQTSWGGEVKNLGGHFGAWVADSLLFVFGSIAYPLPIAISIMTWVLFRKRSEQEDIDFMLWGTRFLGFVVVLLTSCGLADINFDDIWYFSSGGVIGDVLTSLAIPTFNTLGTTLVFLFLWGAGFTLLTGISWLSIVEWLGNAAIGAVTWMLNRFRGTEKEVLEPELTHLSDTPTFDETFEDNVDESLQDNLEPQFSAPEFTSVPDIADTEEGDKRRFNIHMPTHSIDEVNTPEVQPLSAHAEHSSIEDKAADEENYVNEESYAEHSNFGEVAPELEPSEFLESEHEYADQHLSTDPLPTESPLVENYQESERTSDRAKQLGATIEELTQAAEDADDYAQGAELVSDYAPAEALEAEPEVDELRPQETKQQSDDLVTESIIAEEIVPEDPDAVAFQNMVSEAQKNMAGTQNPFLVQAEPNLPVPTSPMPTLELLYHPEKRENHIDRQALEDIARLVESKLADYKIKARVVDIFPGPVITRFELDLAPGVKVSRISSLSMDLARSLSAMAVRVVEVIPGKPYVGLELPNMSRQTVFLSDVINSPQFEEATSPTTIVLGQDIAGEAVIADLSKMPHVLVAGTTGSGKSVGVNVMILSMLYKATPDEVRFIMIDPKMLELSIYEGIPHLLSEVVTDMKDASNALRWCVGEMERRYKLMSALGVRNIKGFNEKLKMAADAGHPIHDPLWQPGDSMDEMPPLLEKLPYIVVVVDEFADMMMVVGKKVEELIARLAQKARAAGIHLILATQRPSVDVITGLIKANIPTRVAFTVSTKTDSRTILDQGGAESLLGMGDMLYLPPGSSHTIRVHGAFASDDDVHSVVNDWKARGKPQYIEDIVKGEQSADTLLPGEKMEGEEEHDPLFDQVVEHVVQSRRGSVSGVQRRFKIGYNRAARIVEQLEAHGIVSAPGHNGNREVLAPPPIKE